MGSPVPDNPEQKERKGSKENGGCNNFAVLGGKKEFVIWLRKQIPLDPKFPTYRHGTASVECCQYLRALPCSFLLKFKVKRLL